MAEMEYYRGGPILRVRDRDIRVNKQTGLLESDRGVSVSSQTEGLDQFGGAFRVTEVPPELRIIQVGAKPHHFEIVPAYPMTRTDFERALDRIKLVPVE
jgi:hypothetical protein